MTDPVQVLSPELEELLVELSADPNSTLLRVERPREFRDLSLRRADVSARRPDWTHAERKLLESYREEVAFLLRYQYYAQFVNDARYAPLRELWTQDRYRGLPADEDRLRDRLATTARSLQSECPADHLNALVSECVGLSQDPTTAPIRLAAASLRLVPHSSARLYMAYEYMRIGWHQAALRVAATEYEANRCPESQSLALDAMAEAQFSLGRPSSAQELCRRALGGGRRRWISMLNAFVLSALSDDCDSLVNLAAQVDSLGVITDEEFQSFLSLLETDRRLFKLSRPEPKRLPVTVKSRLGERSSSVLSAALELR